MWPGSIPIGAPSTLAIGMTPFVKPGDSPSYAEMGADAVRGALADAGLGFEQVQQAYAGYVYGDSTSGQRVIYDVGMTGIPVINVNNNCSTGSTALYLARQAIEHGVADCVLAVGFEQMKPGAVIIDLAAEGGGNCEVTEPGQQITHQEVIVFGPLNVPSELPVHASEMYSKNLLNFLSPMIEDGEFKPDWEDEVIADSTLTRDGEIKHAPTRELVEGEPS